MRSHAGAGWQRLVNVPAGAVSLEGELAFPGEAARGVVLFAHGSGSSRHSPRNAFVAAALRQAGLATLLIDLLTPAEDADYARRFEIDLLTDRLLAATRWLQAEERTRALPLGYFGASTGAAAALAAAAALGPAIAAVVSRGGRPDLALPHLSAVQAPTLLIVGGNDQPVIALNRLAYDALRCPRQIVIVPGATHLFEEPGALEEVARLAVAWFTAHLAAAAN